MKNNNNKSESSRRNFLRNSLTLSAASITGLALASSCSSNDSGEKEQVLTKDGKLVEVDKSAIHHTDYRKPAIGREARKGIPYRKFVMVIDLAKCTNARKCVEKCQHAHQLTPDKEWLKVFRMQDSKNTAPYWFPKPCYHCDNAPCVDVCPVSASYKRSDGIVLIDTDQCIGCKYCMVACSYSARTFNWEKNENIETAAIEYSPETSVPAKVGTVGKCDFCPDLLKNGELPHCAKACPMGVIYMGDLNEDTVTNGSETVRFSELMRDRGGYRYMDYLGTEPNVYYLPPVNRQFPFKEKEEKKA